MRCRAGGTTVEYEEHGAGRPVLVLHGAGVDHHEVEACFELALGVIGGLRRIYPDLPGMGGTPAPSSIRSADDVIEVLLALTDALTGDEPVLLVGHSAGAYHARELAGRRPARVGGLALVCPLLADVRDVPLHRPVVAAPDLGDEGFRGYFVVQTPAMLERYRRLVEPAAARVDGAAMARIGERWAFAEPAPAYPGPTLVVAGRQDSTVGYAAALDLVEQHPRATAAVLDGAGHALPHEQPVLLAALLQEWVARAGAGSHPVDDPF